MHIFRSHWPLGVTKRNVFVSRKHEDSSEIVISRHLRIWRLQIVILLASGQSETQSQERSVWSIALGAGRTVPQPSRAASAVACGLARRQEPAEHRHRTAAHDQRGAKSVEPVTRAEQKAGRALAAKR